MSISSITTISKQAEQDYVTSEDGTRIYFNDWGPKDAQPIVFHHGWPLSGDDWDNQILFFLGKGYRAIAHDRRGHGGGEATRYVARYGKGRVLKLVFIAAVAPIMLKTADNPGGLPIQVFDGYRTALASNRAQLYYDIASGPFYGFNRPGVAASQSVILNWWRQGMMGAANAHYLSIKAFTETDFTEDLKMIEVPTLILHSDDDQVVPIEDSAPLSAKLLKKATLKIYKGLPHGMATTHPDIINLDLLRFIAL
jgi:non-heme chloroperoxidase